MKRRREHEVDRRARIARTERAARDIGLLGEEETDEERITRERREQQERWEAEDALYW